MKIPLYVKTPVKNVHESSGQKKAITEKQAIHNNGPVCEIENTIEIQWTQSYAQICFILLVLFSWLPMLLILFLVHSSVSHQIENSRSLIIAQLENEVSSLSSELLSLRTRLEAMEDMHKIFFNEDRPDVTDLLFLEQIPPLARNKRGVDDGMSNNFKERNLSGRKESVDSSTRRGKQMSSRKHKRPQAQHRNQCPWHRGYINTKFGAFQAVQLKGAHPETVVDNGHVGPWIIDTKAVPDHLLSSPFQLREDGECIEVNSPGLYFIYAQVYYLTWHPLNSFTIKLVPKNTADSSTIAYCSSNTVASSLTSEVSCFTATMHTLQAGDRIYVQQREKHRRLIMRQGHSFLGLIKFVSL